MIRGYKERFLDDCEVYIESDWCITHQRDSRGCAILAFAEAILHGDDTHRAWLRKAAQNWIEGEPLPKPAERTP